MTGHPCDGPHPADPGTTTPAPRRARRLAAVALGAGVVALAALAARGLAGRAPRGDHAAIQGTWTMVSEWGAGDPGPVPVDSTAVYEFVGGRLVVRGRTRHSDTTVWDWYERNFKSATFRLDTGASPKRVEIVWPDRTTVLGLYQLDGDTLRVAVSRPAPAGSGTRPAVFAPTGDGARVLTFRRDRPR